VILDTECPFHQTQNTIPPAKAILGEVSFGVNPFLNIKTGLIISLAALSV
jgi:hypothetical protein